MSFFWNSYNLKNEIKKRMKPFSQLKKEYGIEAIYRRSEKTRFSKNNTYGFPTQRFEVKKEDKVLIDAPVWFAPQIETAEKYCTRDNANLKNLHKILFGNNRKFIEVECATYKYIPYDSSKNKNKNLRFLDLTGIHVPHENAYKLDNKFIRAIYKYILEKILEREGQINDDDDDPYIYSYIIDDTTDKEDFLNAYGYDNGYRDSEQVADNIFTVALFEIIKELKICEEMDCVYMGYYHSDVLNGPDSFFPSEFAIPYKITINPNNMQFCGMVTDNITKTNIDYCAPNKKSSKRRKDSKNSQNDDHSPKKKKNKGGKSIRRLHKVVKNKRQTIKKVIK